MLSRRPAPLSLALLATLLACAEPRADTGNGGGAASYVVVDDVGRELRFDRSPMRVISLVPATTETIQALGAADRLIARTDFDRDPALADLPSVGPGLTPSVEWLVSLRPELVIAWPDTPDRDIAAQLARLGIPVYAARIETLDDVVSTIRRIGAALDLEPAADSLIAEIRAGLDEVRHAVAGRGRPVVFYVIGHEPPMTVGAGTFIHELIELVGGRNAFGDLNGWPVVSLEEALRRRPDLVILPQGEGNVTPGALAGRAGWRELDAVRNGAVHTVDAEEIHRPGPRVAEIARHLAGVIHPDAFHSPAEP